MSKENPIAGLILAALVSQGLTRAIVSTDEDSMTFFMTGGSPEPERLPKKGNYIPSEKPRKKFKHNRRG
jgi:hypothetical protein